jgi:hypothetical protein
MTALFLCPRMLAAQPIREDFAGTWHGTVRAAVIELPVLLTLVTSGERFSGNLKQLDLAAVMPLSNIRVTGESIHVEFRGKIHLVAGPISGFNGRIATA